MSLDSEYSTPDPEWAEAVATQPLGEVPADYEARRRMVNTFTIPRNMAFLEPQLPPSSALHIVDHRVPVHEIETVLVRTITPNVTGAKQTFPVVVWYHGGGFECGTVDFDDYRMRILCHQLQVVAAVMTYRLAPEHPFPTSHRDAYAGLKWVAENASSFGGDLSKGFIVGGASAGGNLAASLSHRAKRDPFFEGRRLTGTVLQIPNLCHLRGYPKEYHDQLQSIMGDREWPVLTRKYLEGLYDKGLKAPANDPEVSPLLDGDRHLLPPTFLQINGLDPLRDEGILYERLLREAGVPTEMQVYPGVPHGVHISWPQLKVSKTFEEDLRGGVKWLLSLPKTKA